MATVSKDGIHFDEATQTYVGRHTILTAGRTIEEARAALASAVQLTARTWPPRIFQTVSAIDTTRFDLDKWARAAAGRALITVPIDEFRGFLAEVVADGLLIIAGLDRDISEAERLTLATTRELSALRLAIAEALGYSLSAMPSDAILVSHVAKLKREAHTEG